MSYVASSRPGAASQERRAFFKDVRLAALPGATFRPLARVLVSDDDPAIRQLHTALLLDHGFEVLTTPAGDGPATLALARSARPQLLITDVNKPGLDGHALRAALRADGATARIPVLMVSAMDPWAEPGRAPAGPLDDYLLKPFSAEQLLYRVAALLPLDAAGHDRLVERARRLPCLEHTHPVTGLPCLHSLARQLPALTAEPGWAAVSVELAAFPALVRALGRPAAEGLLARLGGVVSGASDLLVAAHTGFDPRIALVGSAAAVAVAAAQIPARFEAARRLVTRLHPRLPHSLTRLHMRSAGDADGLGLGLGALRAALRG